MRAGYTVDTKYSVKPDDFVYIHDENVKLL